MIIFGQTKNRMHKIRHDAQDAGKPCIPKILNYPLHHAACDHAYPAMSFRQVIRLLQLFCPTRPFDAVRYFGL